MPVTTPTPVRPPAVAPVAVPPAPPRVAEATPAPAPVTPAPTPSPAVIYPPAELTIHQLLADPETYRDKRVRVAGLMQFRDAGRESFDLSESNDIVPVRYGSMSTPAKNAVGQVAAGARVAVIGAVRLEAADSSVSLTAESVTVAE